MFVSHLKTKLNDAEENVLVITDALHREELKWAYARIDEAWQFVRLEGRSAECYVHYLFAPSVELPSNLDCSYEAEKFTKNLEEAEYSLLSYEVGEALRVGTRCILRPRPGHTWVEVDLAQALVARHYRAYVRRNRLISSRTNEEIRRLIEDTMRHGQVPASVSGTLITEALEKLLEIAR